VTAVAGAVAALGLLLVPGRADAHAELVSTEPAASQQLTTAPDQVVLHFTESVDMTDDTIGVLDATGTRVQVGEPEHPGGDGAAVAASLPDLDDGAYVVAWRVVSSDSPRTSTRSSSRPSRPTPAARSCGGSTSRSRAARSPSTRPRS
jgi:copper transport protein